VVGKNDSLSSNPKNPDGSTAPKFKSNQVQTGFTLGGPIVRDHLFYFGALDVQKASSTKQTNPARIEQRVVDWFATFGSQPYNGPNITGQNRPLPDTAFDFARGYRFGEPFFIPVKYYDTRVQFNNNVSYLSGAHSYKAGVEFNRVNSVQTFIGFANGRYIFS